MGRSFFKAPDSTTFFEESTVCRTVVEAVTLTDWVTLPNSNLRTTNWIAAAEAVSIVGTNYKATALSTNGPRFFRLSHP